MTDSLLDAINGLMDAVDSRLTTMRAEIAEIRTVPLTETRAAEPVAGPPGRDGRDGKDGANGTNGRDGIDGKVGEKGERGADGINGRDGAPSTIPGPKGETGERGADGIATAADLDARIEARFNELQVRTFADVYQGVYEHGKLYTRGLLATWGGSLWLSLADTNAKPGETGDWKLVVKKGADGRK